MGTPHNQRTGPLPYEIHSGDRRNGSYRVTRTLSLTEADKAYRRLIAEGESAEIWLGDMRLKNGGGPGFTSMGGTYEGGK